MSGNKLDHTKFEFPEIPGAINLAPGTVADLIIWLDQQGFEKDDKRTLLIASGITPDQIEYAQEIVVERYASPVFRKKVGKQRHGRKW